MRYRLDLISDLDQKKQAMGQREGGSPRWHSY